MSRTVTPKSGLASMYQAFFRKGRVRNPNAGNQFDVGEWEACFAWRPVRLYGTSKYAWLRKISRRPVLLGLYHLKMDYTDIPGEFPAD